MNSVNMQLAIEYGISGAKMYAFSIEENVFIYENLNIALRH